MLNLTLNDINTEEAQLLLPVVIYTLVMIIAGFLGNFHVFLVVRRGYKHHSTFRIFVLTLAIVDMIMCVTTMPFEVYLMTYPFMFYNRYICKGFRFINMAMAAASSFILVTIATERYRRVCRPLKPQLSPRMVRRLCVISVAIAVIISSPSILFQGLKEIDVGHNITGIACTIQTEYRESWLYAVFNGIALFIFCFNSILISFMFCCVVRTIRKQKSKRKTLQSATITYNSTEYTRPPEDIRTIGYGRPTEDEGTQLDKHTASIHQEVNFVSTLQNNDICESAASAINVAIVDTNDPIFDEQFKINKNIISIHQGEADYGNFTNSNKRGFEMTNHATKEGESVNIETSTKQQLTSISRSIKSVIQKCKHKKKMGSHTTVLLLITIFFILSYLPYLGISFAESIHYVQVRNTETKAVYFFLLRTYFINSAINPIIYCFIDGVFRREMKILYSGFFLWIHAIANRITSS